ncbi:cytochrome d ubiquinol oxidase subunit II [Azospirillum sp. TSO22-1]|uniref:cytochrome d ubiquinol oxidase subunit II n=1 Tax=Azospirillum sp. TSO22-1 TaxID=716789 RepID=UPI000D6125B3|nr:cytochrome d ubiquinol oxidase subunit II [Azospirillum sp. TSO22-1]PWC41161.1 ubiquinol oxidase subunit II [Azospirillum sp. TSO22-1]
MDLPLIWSAIIALGVFMYVLLDGFDLGVGILFPFVREKRDRDAMMNSVAPIWDGNETWLILGGASLLGAFPLAYATLLPAFYIPIMVMLFGLIFRGVAFEFRFKSTLRWPWWDASFFLGSLVATVMQGILLGAFITGVPVEAIEAGNWRYTGGALDWLTPFNLMCGAGLVCGYALLGATWLVLKTEGHLQRFSYRAAWWLAALVAAFLVVVSLWTPFAHPAIRERWFSWPNLLYLSPVPLVTGAVVLALFAALQRRRELAPFVLTMALFALSFLGLAISLWPYVVPRALTIWDAASPRDSQIFLLVGVAFLLPVILGYTVYSYRVFRGKVEEGYH